jgi:hypothetical protein
MKLSLALLNYISLSIYRDNVNENHLIYTACFGVRVYCREIQDEE